MPERVPRRRSFMNWWKRTKRRAILNCGAGTMSSLRAQRGHPIFAPRAQCKVHPDHHVRFGQALYSVPTRWDAVWGLGWYCIEQYFLENLIDFLRLG